MSSNKSKELDADIARVSKLWHDPVDWKAELERADAEDPELQATVSKPNVVRCVLCVCSDHLFVCCRVYGARART